MGYASAIAFLVALGFTVSGITSLPLAVALWLAALVSFVLWLMSKKSAPEKSAPKPQPETDFGRIANVLHRTWTAPNGRVWTREQIAELSDPERAAFFARYPEAMDWYLQGL